MYDTLSEQCQLQDSLRGLALWLRSDHVEISRSICSRFEAIAEERVEINFSLVRR